MNRDTTTDADQTSFGDVPPTRNEQIDRLIARWPELEAELEASGRNEQLEELLIDYVKNLHVDNLQVQILRNLVVVAVSLLLVFLWSSFPYLISLSALDPTAQVAFIVGLFALTGVFVTVFLRGAFKLAKDRHGDNLPENVKTMISAMNLSGD